MTVAVTTTVTKTTFISKRVPKIFLFIKSPAGNTVSVAVNVDDSIGALKQILQTKEGFPSDNVELTFEGEVMSDNRTVADYSLLSESLISLSFRHVVHNETSGYAVFDQTRVEDDSVFGISTTTLVGMGALLVVILITVPLIVYRTVRRRKNAGREQLMDVYAAAYQKDGYNGPGKPFARYPSSSNTESVISNTPGGVLRAHDPKTFFDLVFDRFDLDPAPFDHDSHGVSTATDEENVYESAVSLRKQAKMAKKNGGSFSLHDFAAGESDTDTETGGNVGRKGIFKFRMTSNGNEESDEDQAAKKKKKKKVKKKKQELNIGKRVLQPQWFHGDTARPSAFANTDQLQYDDSEMFVTTPPPSGLRKQSRLVDKNSTGYSEVLKTPNPPPRRRMQERNGFVPPPTNFFQDGGYADASGVEERKPLPRQRMMSPEGFEDLPELRGLPSGLSDDDLLDQDDMLLFEGGYIETSASKMAARKANGTVGEYLDANSSPTGDQGYIDSKYMTRRARDGGYLDGRQQHSIRRNSAGEYLDNQSPNGDDGEYLRAEEHDTNDEYMQTDGSMMSQSQAGNSDEDDDGLGNLPAFRMGTVGPPGTYSNTHRMPNLSGNYHQTLRTTSFAQPRRARPLDGGMALPSLSALSDNLPNFDDIASNGLTGITGGLSGVSAIEMDWVAAQWDRANNAFDVPVDGSVGSGSNAVKSNPLFEDLSDVSDDDGSAVPVTES